MVASVTRSSPHDNNCNAALQPYSVTGQLKKKKLKKIFRFGIQDKMLTSSAFPGMEMKMSKNIQSPPGKKNKNKTTTPKNINDASRRVHAHRDYYMVLRPSTIFSFFYIAQEEDWFEFARCPECWSGVLLPRRRFVDTKSRPPATLNALSY